MGMGMSVGGGVPVGVDVCAGVGVSVGVPVGVVVSVDVGVGVKTAVDVAVAVEVAVGVGVDVDVSIGVLEDGSSDGFADEVAEGAATTSVGREPEPHAASGKMINTNSQLRRSGIRNLIAFLSRRFASFAKTAFHLVKNVSDRPSLLESGVSEQSLLTECAQLPV